MSKNTETKNVEVKELVEEPKLDMSEKDLALEAIEKAASREQKKKLRRAALENLGPLHLDQKYKRDGFRQRLVNVTPGNIAKREIEGYRVINVDPSAQAGNGTIDTAHATGGHLEVEVGRRESAKAVWMEISEEDAQILDEIRDDAAREQAGMIYKSEIPENVRIGKVSEEE